jgi:hypothetical protein
MDACERVRGDRQVLCFCAQLRLFLDDHLNHKQLLADNFMAIREKIITVKALAIFTPLRDFGRCESLCCCRWSVDGGHR